MFKEIKKRKCIQKLYALFLRYCGNNHFHGISSNFCMINGLLHNTEIDLHGRQNSVVIRNPKYVNRLHIFINGNGNVIDVDENCVLKDLTLWIEDDNSQIHIGKNTLFCGTCQLSCIEGTEIEIGDECMFSSGINVRTGDSHSILDADGRRINPSQSVSIGKHVWCGQNVTILKGAQIAANSICGTGAVVTKKFEKSGIVLAGAPAKIVKENISWCFNRI